MRPPVEAIGRLDGQFIYDAPHDNAYATALLQLMTDKRAVIGDTTRVTGHSALRETEARDSALGVRSRVLTGEQSNTSIIFERKIGTGMPVICKLFRAVQSGDNPDVELQSVLAAAGSHAVPQPVGHVVAEWNDPNEPEGHARGHLAFAQEFLLHAEDAWRSAVRAAALGQDFGVHAYELGAATARMHQTLADQLPTQSPTPAHIGAAIAQLNSTLAAAIAAVPELKRYAQGIAAIFDRAAHAPWPRNQRIHGDLHLGQVLGVTGRDWIFVDFEGEPLRPMIERRRIDSPLRDVAGMLRSFDYAAGSVAMTASSSHAADWVTSARSGFLTGYSEVSGYDIRVNTVLIDAFEIGKALYETAYEAGNRPDWLPIPIAAINRLAARLIP